MPVLNRAGRSTGSGRASRRVSALEQTVKVQPVSGCSVNTATSGGQLIRTGT